MSIPAGQIGLDFSSRAPALEEKSPIPGEHLKDRIRASVRTVLVTLAQGRAAAITGERLAEAVAGALRESGVEVTISARSMKRRCQEAVAELVEAGEEIASASDHPAGYFIAQTKEEIRAAVGQRWRKVASEIRRARRYDRNVADRLLALLGQLGIDLGEGQPS